MNQATSSTDTNTNFGSPIKGSRLEALDVVMHFGGVQALTGTSLNVEPGKITSLIGPNGAGKTTLFNIISGFLNPTSGTVFLDGKNITRKGIAHRSRLGIARTFQKLEAFNTLSARDNILVAAEMHGLKKNQKHKESFGDTIGGPHLPHIYGEVDDLLAQVNLSDVADITVGTLPTGTARLVELARALATRPSILLLDEPSSGLDETETEEMAGILTSFSKRGLTVLLVEHDMSFVMGVSDFIYVLDFGSIIAQDVPEKIQNDPQVRAAYLGSH